MRVFRARFATLIPLSLALVLACDGCKERSPSHSPDASVAQAAEGDGGEWRLETQGVWRDLAITTHLWPLAGPVDVSNRYPWAVRVLVEFPEHQEALSCGGVIVSSRWVLTAGHCVCRARRVSSESGEVHTQVDGSECAETATIKTTLYEPRDGASEPSWSGSYQRGRVYSHPEFSVVLDPQEQVISSHADLALIFMDPAINEEFSPLAISDQEIALNESLTVVGAGYDETAKAYDGERRVSRNKVLEELPAGGGMMRIEQPEGHHYLGDSGGPCVRERAGRSELVGLSSRNLGKGEAIISIHGYRAWLREMIQNRHPPQMLPRHR